MRTRLNSCDRLHAGEESEIRLYVHKGRAAKQERCLKCVRIDQRMRYLGTHPGFKPEVRLYGVLPRLNWTPPNL